MPAFTHPAGRRMKESPPRSSAGPAVEGRQILLALHHENSAQARHHEQQRQWATAVVAVAAAFLLASLPPRFEAPLRHNYPLLLQGLFLLAGGVYGFLVSLHHHERSRLHVQRVHAVRRRISQTLPVDILDLYGEANRDHAKRFPTLSNRTARVHYLWLGLHATVAFIGLALTALVLLAPTT
jgi:hypothetical protein